MCEEDRQKERRQLQAALYGFIEDYMQKYDSGYELTDDDLAVVLADLVAQIRGLIPPKSD